MFLWGLVEMRLWGFVDEELLGFFVESLLSLEWVFFLDFDLFLDLLLVFFIGFKGE